MKSCMQGVQTEELTFSSAINLSNNAGSSVEPAIAVSGNRVFVVWDDNTQGDEEIFYRRSVDGGVSFGSTRKHKL